MFINQTQTVIKRLDGRRHGVDGTDRRGDQRQMYVRHSTAARLARLAPGSAAARHSVANEYSDDAISAAAAATLTRYQPALSSSSSPHSISASQCCPVTLPVRACVCVCGPNADTCVCLHAPDTLHGAQCTQSTLQMQFSLSSQPKLSCLIPQTDTANIRFAGKTTTAE